MGKLVSYVKMGTEKYMGSLLPVILCGEKANGEQSLAEAGFSRFALNGPLAELLSSKPEQDRTDGAREAVLALLPKQSAIYMVDYEMLFDPRYGLDVLKLFCEIARRQRLAVRLCGGLASQTLVYAEPGYPEYKRYRIADYDIICVE